MRSLHKIINEMRIDYFVRLARNANQASRMHRRIAPGSLFAAEWKGKELAYMLAARTLAGRIIPARARRFCEVVPVAMAATK